MREVSVAVHTDSKSGQWERFLWLSAQTTRVDNERGFCGCPHRQQEWMVTGVSDACPHRQTTRVDDERVSVAVRTDRQQEWMITGVSEAYPHRQWEWMMRGFLLMLVHTDNKSGWWEGFRGLSTQTTKVDDVRGFWGLLTHTDVHTDRQQEWMMWGVSEVCPHTQTDRQQEWMTRGFLMLSTHTDNKNGWWCSPTFFIKKCFLVWILLSS